MRRPRTIQPYQLAYWPPTNELFARGDPEIVLNVTDYPSARVVGDLATDGYVALPASRRAILCLEALTSVESAGEEYVSIRRELMTLPTKPLYDLWPTLNIHLNRTLMQHQVEFCAFAQPLRGAFNASEQGTGKTTTGWVMAHVWGSRRTLIVAPKSLISEWRADYQLLFRAAPIQCIPIADAGVISRGAAIESYASSRERLALIINYEVLERLEPQLTQFHPDTIIFDESWRIKSPRAKTTRAAIRLADQAEHVLLLTGTPIGNDVGDFFTQLRTIDPNFQTRGRTLIQAHDSFMQRYARFENRTIDRFTPRERQITKAVGCVDPAGLMARLEPTWYRATKATCLDLPPKIHDEPVIFNLPPHWQEFYRNVDEQGIAALGDPISLADRRVAMIRLHQIAGGFQPTPLRPDELPPTNAQPPTNVADDLIDLTDLDPENLLRRWVQVPIDPWPKIEWLRTFTDDQLLHNPTYRVLIWARYTAEIERIYALLSEVLGEQRVAMATGRTRNDELDDIKLSFNSRHPSGVQVIVCQWRKMAFGHNLQAGDHHVRYSHDWSYINYQQAEDRSHRAGRNHAVRYTDLLMRGTIDELVMDALRRKQNLAIQLAPDTVGAIHE